MQQCRKIKFEEHEREREIMLKIRLKIFEKSFLSLFCTVENITKTGNYSV